MIRVRCATVIPFAPYGSAIIAWTQKTLHPLNAVFELLEQNQKLTTMVACDAAKKDELMNIVYAMLKTEHRIQPKEVELYDHRLN